MEEPDHNDSSFNDAVESLMSAAEERVAESHHPFTSTDMQKLQQLCANWEEQSRSGTVMQDLGFADVDPDVSVQLVEFLAKHVALASNVDLIRAAYEHTQLIKKKKEDVVSMDAWISSSAGALLIETLRLGLEAATILLFIVNSPAIDRRVVNEDAIEASIVLFRHNLAKNIIPAINQVGHIVAAVDKATAAVATPSSAKKRRRSHSSLATASDAAVRNLKKIYKPILSMVGPTVLVMERLDTLVQKVDLDAQHLFTISSGAMQALELDPPAQNAVNPTHQLHIAMIGIVTSIFRKYPIHRQILIEDLFPLMLKMPTSRRAIRNFPLQCSSILYPNALASLSESLILAAPNNTNNVDTYKLQTLSAMVLSLVQSAVVRPTFEEFKEQDHTSNDGTAGAHYTPKSGLSDCRAASDMFVKLLLQRCTKKGEDGGASEFRPILSNLIDDLLLVLLVPEYPAAEMILMSVANMICHDLVKTTSPKVMHTAETTYLNTAFDALSKICAAEAIILKFNREHPVRLKTDQHPADAEHIDCHCNENEKNDCSILSCDQCKTWFHLNCVGLSRDMVPQEWLCDVCQLARVVEFEGDRNANMGEHGCAQELIDISFCMRRLVLDYLSIMARQSGELGKYDAYAFQLSRWLLEIRQQNTSPQSQNGDLEIGSNPTPLLSRLLELWDPRESSDISKGGNVESLSGMLNCLSEEGRSRMVVHLASKQSSLLMSFRSRIGLFVSLMGNDNYAVLRKLAVKAIEKISAGDPQLMLYPFIRKAVTARFSDEAISVREAAVSLVGSYVVNTPAVANAFHRAFVTGLHDPGVSVRKKSVKILQSVLTSNPDYKGRAAACSAMLNLAANPKEDDAVRDSIHDLFLKLWFESGDQSVEKEVEIQEGSPETNETLTSPNGRIVEPTESRTPVGLVTPGAKTPITPTPSNKTRTTDRVNRRKRMQIRSEIAAEQMVEVVKAADTSEDLTALFRELLSGLMDADKGRKAKERKKRMVLAKGHCAMLVDALFEMLVVVEENPEEFEAIGPGRHTVAIMRTVKVFTEVSPADVFRQLDTLLPYLKGDNGFSPEEEAVTVSTVCDVLSRVAQVFTKGDINALPHGVAEDLVKITYKYGRDALSSAVCALCAIAHHKETALDSPFRSKLLKLAQDFYSYLRKHSSSGDIASKTAKAKVNMQRALSVLGSICRYHESAQDEIAMDTESVSGDEPLSFTNLTVCCEVTFTTFLKKDDPQIKCAALRGLCGIFISHPREMLRMDQSGLISSVMAHDSPPSLQVEALRCWRDILLTEEERVESGRARAKMESKKNITLSKKISGDQDADATLFGGILTSHAARLLEMTQVRYKEIRFAALDLIGNLLRQGQVNPNETVPFLLALQGDVEENEVRSLALKLLMIEGEKRPDMLRQRVRAGVKQAYLFQKSVYPDKKVSALVQVGTGVLVDAECVFAQVFKECIASVKKQRLGLYRTLLGLFDLEARKSQSCSSVEKTIAELPLLSFTSQVLAYLPYAVASDPLYIIHQITTFLSLQGPDLLERMATFLRPHGLSSRDEMDETNVEEDALERAAKRKVPRHAKEATPLLSSDFDTLVFSGLCAEAGALALLLRLKSFLRKAYNLSEARCLAYNPEDKDRIGEKGTTRNTAVMFDSTLPIQGTSAKKNKTGVDHMILQYAEFRVLMREDSISEVRSDDSDDDAGIARVGKRKRGESEDTEEN